MTSERHRKKPSHNEIMDRFGRSNILFVTVCAKQRTPQFNNPIFHEAILQTWRQSDHWIIGKYILMPDHIHFFCSPGIHPARSLRLWVKYWKRLVTQELKADRNTTLWQGDCWDRQIRNGAAYSEKWAYVRNNPVRAGLVDTPDAWPYSGELNQLMWRGP